MGWGGGFGNGLGGVWLGGLRKEGGEGGRNGMKETKADEKLLSFSFQKVSMVLKKKNTLVFQRKVYVLNTR